MIFFVVAWIILGAVCFTLGRAILHWVQADCFKRIGDRLLLSIWLGIVILAVSLLSVSLFLPLSPLVGIGVVFASVGLALILYSPKDEIIAIRTISASWLPGLTVLTLFVAAFASGKMVWYDTGLYHFSLIQWLSQVGTVPGLALIHFRFGFNASWFALIAPWNSYVFEARVGALWGGFVFLLGGGHLLISCTRIFQKSQKFADWFIVIALFMCLPISIAGRGKMPVSTSPDLPVLLLTVIVAWTIIVILSSPPSVNPNLKTDARAIPLVLAAGAVTMKLNAIPVLLVASCFYILKQKTSILRIFIGGVLVFFLLLPMWGYGIVTSGCPLFPSSKLCLNLPWTIEESRIEKITLARFWEKQATDEDSELKKSSLKYWWLWAKHYQRASLLIIGSIISAIFLLIPKKRQYPGQNYIITLGILGIFFVLASAPKPNFALGYLCLIPAFAMAKIVCVPNKIGAIVSLIFLEIVMVFFVNRQLGINLVVTTLLIFAFQNRLRSIAYIRIILVVFFLALVENSLSNFRNLPYHVLLPSKLKTQTELVQKTVNDINYFSPLSESQRGKDDRCWAAPPPCTPYLTYEDIKLRVPERGFRGGFKRVSS